MTQYVLRRGGVALPPCRLLLIAATVLALADTIFNLFHDQ